MNKKLVYIVIISILVLSSFIFLAMMIWKHFKGISSSSLQETNYNISYANVYAETDNINNLLYVTEKGSNKIDIYDLNTLKLSDSITLGASEYPSDNLRVYVDGNEKVALLNSKEMTTFELLDLKTKKIRCAVNVGKDDIGWVDTKDKLFIQSSANQFILYDYNCTKQKAIDKNSIIISKTSENGEIGVFNAKDFSVSILNLASGVNADSFSVADKGTTLLPQHNMVLNNNWFAANFNQTTKGEVDIAIYNRNTKATSWVNIPGSTVAPSLKPVYLVGDLYFLGIGDNGKQEIVITDLKNKNILNKIIVNDDAVAYAVDTKGENIFILNKSGKITKKSVVETNSAAAKPLNFAAVIHLEGQLQIPNETVYLDENSTLKQIIDLFKKYDAKITIESEEPYIEAANKWGNNMLTYALNDGMGVGTHCDFDSMSQEAAVAAYKARKDMVDAVVSAKNNLGCSGGWGTHDWAQAANSAGFSYLDCPVMIAYLAVPEENRPINPDTGKHYTDAEIAPGSRLYYHDPIPPELEDAIYPRRLKDTNNLIGDDSGIVLIPGSLGEIASLSEGRKNCYPNCTLTADDTKYIFDKIDYVNSFKDNSKVSSLNLHFPDYTLKKGGEESIKIIEDWLKKMQEYQNQGKIKWVTMKEIYEEYNDANPAATNQTQTATIKKTQTPITATTKSVHNKCGDGTCDSVEKQSGMCPQDCK